jgi:hypothetical protein
MAKNALNGGMWPTADVFVGSETATIPEDGADFDALTWDDVGILSGEEGFGGERSVDTSEAFGWGGILVDTSTRNFKTTREFTVMEENEQTMGLIWPGSTLTWSTANGVDGYSGDLVQPDFSKRFRLGFVQEKSGLIRVAVTRGFAKLATVEITEGGEDTAFQAKVTADIFPDATGSYFYVYKGARATP